MQQIIGREHKMQEGHTLTKLSDAHNSCYGSWLLTLPNYIQHDSKIIILTTFKKVYSLKSLHQSKNSSIAQR